MTYRFPVRLQGVLCDCSETRRIVIIKILFQSPESRGVCLFVCFWGCCLFLICFVYLGILVCLWFFFLSFLSFYSFPVLLFLSSVLFNRALLLLLLLMLLLVRRRCPLQEALDSSPCLLISVS